MALFRKTAADAAGGARGDCGELGSFRRIVLVRVRVREGDRAVRSRELGLFRKFARRMRQPPGSNVIYVHMAGGPAGVKSALPRRRR